MSSGSNWKFAVGILVVLVLFAVAFMVYMMIPKVMM